MHISHLEVVPRLKRAEGHLRSIISVIEDGRSCAEVAQQLHAVEAAVAKAKNELIKDHIEHCLEDGAADVKSAMRELKRLAKYLWAPCLISQH